MKSGVKHLQFLFSTSVCFGVGVRRQAVVTGFLVLRLLEELRQRDEIFIGAGLVLS